MIIILQQYVFFFLLDLRKKRIWQIFLDKFLDLRKKRIWPSVFDKFLSLTENDLS